MPRDERAELVRLHMGAQPLWPPCGGNHAADIFLGAVGEDEQRGGIYVGDVGEFVPGTVFHLLPLLSDIQLSQERAEFQGVLFRF